MKAGFFTIIAKNYLAYAKTLCNSIKKIHPEASIFIVLADKIDDNFCSLAEFEPFIYVPSEQLEIREFQSFSFKYDVVELATAIKPYAFDFILNNYCIDKLIYLDPDIYVFQRLDYVFYLLNDHSVILTPHVTKSFPNDGKGMIDRHILLAGLFNLGFIAISKNTNSERFLEWWKEKLYDECLMDSVNAMCVDQKWIDFVPLMFESVYILREPGYNVAYWNLHERKIEFIDNSWYCNGQLLFFFHFSGILVDNLEKISKYQNRYNLNNYPVLVNMFEFYRNLLLENGYYKYSKAKYSYNYFLNGSKINKRDRDDYYRLGVERHQIANNPFSNKQYFQWKKIVIINNFKLALKKVFKK